MPIPDHLIWPVSQWRTPATDYPRRQLGEARVCERRYPKGVYHMYMVPNPAGTQCQFYRALKPLPITTLKIKNRIWMVDDPPHYLAMLEHASYYSGKVLVAGLGLGLIAHALAANSQVTDILIIERSQDVITLVQPLIPERVRLIHADWYGDLPEFAPDGVFYDLFVGDGYQQIPAAIREMIHLKQRFRSAQVFRIHGYQNDELNCMTDAVVTQDLAIQDRLNRLGNLVAELRQDQT